MIEVTASHSSSDHQSKKRRKQSNPTRLSTSSDASSAVESTAETTAVLHHPLVPETGEKYSRDRQADDDDDDDDQDDEILNTTGVFSCSHCDGTFNTEQSLGIHVRDKHVPEFIQLLKCQLINSGKVSPSSPPPPPSSSSSLPPPLLPSSARSVSRGSSLSSSSTSPPLATGGTQMTSDVTSRGRSTRSPGTSESAVSINSTGHREATGAATAAAAVASVSPSLPFALPGQSSSSGSLPLGMFSNQFLYSLTMPSAQSPTTPTTNGVTSSPLSSTTCTGSRGSTHPPTTGSQTSSSSTSSSCIFNRSAYCDLCNKEFCNKYFLRTHKANKHKIFVNDSPPATGCNVSRSQSPKSPLYQIVGSNSNTSFTASNAIVNTSVSPCGVTPTSTLSTVINTVESTSVVPSHVSPFIVPHGTGKLSSHVDDTSSVEFYSEYNSSRTASPPVVSTMIPSTVSNGKLISSPSPATGSNVSRKNYCHICNKELCNKYFMKTHMLKMHGINIDENPAEAAVSSTIGGVTCDICQKELCSKYFLKVHRQNTHGIMDETTMNGRDTNGSSGGRGRRSTLLEVNTPDSHSFSLPRIGYEGTKIPEGNHHHNLPPNSSYTGYAAAVAAVANVHLTNSTSHPAPTGVTSVPSDATVTGNRLSVDKNGTQFTLSTGGKYTPSAPSEMKDTSSNQHFRHYTEVCALCERRFKSIKWLKTHMANDHADVLPAFLAKLNSSNGFNHLFNNLYRAPKLSTSNTVKSIPCDDLRGKSNLTSLTSRSSHGTHHSNVIASKKVKSSELNCSPSARMYDHDTLSLIQQFNKGSGSTHDMLASSSPHHHNHCQQLQQHQPQHNNNNLFNVSLTGNVNNNNNNVKENKKDGKTKESTVSLNSSNKLCKEEEEDEDDDDDEEEEEERGGEEDTDDSHSSGRSSHQSHMSSSVKSNESAENDSGEKLIHFTRKTNKNNDQQDADGEYDDDDDDNHLSIDEQGKNAPVNAFNVSGGSARGALKRKADAMDEDDASDHQESFVPSLVYLPVVKKIDEPVTVAFHLTPA